MQAELGAFGADLLLALAGFGVLLAIGLKPRGGMGALGAAGLAYITGSAVVPLVITALLVLGVPFSLFTFLAIVIACGGLGAWRAGQSILPPQRFSRADAPKSWRTWGPETWIIIVFVVAFSIFAIVGFWNAWQAPLLEWDAWTIWARKAQVLSDHDSLWSPFFKNPVYSFSHLDYPLQFPIWEAIHFRAAGTFSTSTLLRHIWLLLVGFIWGMAYVVHVYGRVRPIVWAPILLLLATAPAVWQQVNGNADLPLAMFVCFGAILMALWLSNGDNRLLTLGAIMLAAAANTKNEGTATAVVVLVVVGAVVLWRKLDLRAYLYASGATVLFGVVLWHLWLAAQDIKSDLPISKGVDPAYLWDRTWRIGPAITALVAQMSDQSRWVYLVPMAALCVAVSLVSGLGRRVATFYLTAFLLISAVFVWIFWISPYGLSWHLETSVPRIVSIPMFIAAAAILHLGGLFVAALARPGTMSFVSQSALAKEAQPSAQAADVNT